MIVSFYEHSYAKKSIIATTPNRIVNDVFLSSELRVLPLISPEKPITSHPKTNKPAIVSNVLSFNGLKPLEAAKQSSPDKRNTNKIRKRTIIAMVIIYFVNLINFRILKINFLSLKNPYKISNLYSSRKFCSYIPDLIR